MNADCIHHVFRNQEATKHLKWIHISGGEIFLNKSALYDIIAAISLHFNKNIGISTNGFWAKTNEETAEIIAQLHTLGVTGVAVSTDYYHTPFVSVERVKRVAHAIETSNMRTHCYIMSARNKEHTQHATEINNISEQLTSKAQAGLAIPLAPTKIRSIGLGATINIPKTKHIPQGMCTDISECLGKRGPMNPTMVWIDCYGNVMICYGIIIGNIYNTPFATIIKNYSPQQNTLLQELSAHGPKGLHALAKSKGIEMPEEYFDECDLCYTSRKKLQTYYAELGPPECYPE